MLRKFLLILVLILSSASCIFAYSGGSGTKNSPYIIASYDDMNQLRTDTNTYGSSDIYYKLSDDIQMTRYNWTTSIGSSSSPFAGHFNGNGCTVYVHFRDNDNSSLFGYVSSDAVIENLKVEGEIYSYGDAAGIVHTLDGGEVVNCRFSGNIYVTDYPSTVSTNLNAGGIVEYMTSGTVADCIFNGEIIINGGIYPRSGGIVSLMHGGSITGCSITHYSKIASYAYEGDNSSAISGGIAGQVNIKLDETIEGCAFRGEVIAESSGTGYAGGIAGYVRGGTLTNNIVLDDSFISSSYSAGGIAGILRSGGTIDSNHVYAGSVIRADSQSAGGVTGILDLGNVTSNDSFASVTGDASYKGGVIGEVTPATSNPATGRIINNRYSGYDYAIGRDASGLPSGRGSTKIPESELPFRITTSSNLPTVKVDVPYSQTFETYPSSASMGYVTWTLDSGDIPSGLAFNAGTLSGTPTAAGTFTFTLSAYMSSSQTHTKTFTLTVEDTLVITTSSYLPDGKAGMFYEGVTLETDAEDGLYVTWSSSNMPDGLEVGYRSGIISGTPATEGYYTFTVTAVSGQYTASKEFTILITPSLKITNDSKLPSAFTGQNYSVTLSTDASDFDAQYITWSCTSLPEGLRLDSKTGTISGIPSSQGTFTFIITASLETPSGTYTDSKDFTLTVSSGIEIHDDTVLPSAVINREYSHTLSLSGDLTPELVTWEFISGNLPEGFSFDNSTGTVSGTSSREGIYHFTAEAEVITSEYRFYVRKTFTLRVSSELIIMNNDTYTIDAGSSFSLNLSARISGSSEQERIEWSVISGNLPSGLSLNGGGTLSGIPLRAGTFTFTLQAVQGYSMARKDMTFKVNLVISSPSYLPNGIKGESYSEVLHVNGAASALWSLVSSDLPPGLALSSAGMIQGIPTAEGTYDFMLNASDNNDNGARKTMRITIISYSTLPITTASLPSGKSGEEYYAELHSGVSNAQWEITDGHLPSGLTLNQSNGLISGIPAESGTFTFIVRASYGLREGTRQFTLWIEPADVIVSDDEHASVSSSGGGGGCNTGLNLAVFFLLGYNVKSKKSKITKNKDR